MRTLFWVLLCAPLFVIACEDSDSTDDKDLLWRDQQDGAITADASSNDAAEEPCTCLENHCGELSCGLDCGACQSGYLCLDHRCVSECPAVDDPIGDADGDGIANAVEDKDRDCSLGEDETDPTNGDTDDDGRLDGDEDINGNGFVEAWETDPRESDSDQDGVLDGDEPFAPVCTQDLYNQFDYLALSNASLLVPSSEFYPEEVANFDGEFFGHEAFMGFVYETQYGSDLDEAEEQLLGLMQAGVDGELGSEDDLVLELIEYQEGELGLGRCSVGKYRSYSWELDSLGAGYTTLRNAWAEGLQGRPLDLGQGEGGHCSPLSVKASISGDGRQERIALIVSCQSQWSPDLTRIIDSIVNPSSIGQAGCEPRAAHCLNIALNDEAETVYPLANQPALITLELVGADGAVDYSPSSGWSYDTENNALVIRGYEGQGELGLAYLAWEPGE